MIAFARPEPDDCDFEDVTCEVVAPCPHCEYDAPASYTLTISGFTETPIQCDVCEDEALEFLKNAGVPGY